MSKITINFLKNKIDYSGKYPVLIWKGEPRTPKIILEYESEKAFIKTWWENVEDYILVKFLRFKQSTKTINSFRKCYAIRQKKSLKFILTKNNFPYKGFDHQILWIADDQDIEKALDFAFEEYKDKDYIYFQNLLQTQSVKGLTHFHFLTLKKTI